MIAKLYSGRATDMQDIIDPNVLRQIDWERLEYLATDPNEARASALNEFRYGIVIRLMSGGGSSARTHFQRISHSVCEATI